MIRRLLTISFLLLLAGSSPVPVVQSVGSQPASIVVDDFESYGPGELPTKWKYLHDNRLVPLTDDHMRPRERFFVAEEGGGNRVCRVYTDGEAVHLTMLNEPEGFDWNLETHPRLSWDWRALRLPPSAREDIERLNDTGAGLYVIFRMEGFLVKRPKAVKYTYSSSLPVGTVVDYGKLKVLVVSSGVDGNGDWERIERNVADDYRFLFGGEPPARPLSIRLWGDSDNTDSVGEADFDNIMLLGAR